MGEFDDCFDELWSLAYRVAFRILGDREDAADVAQESLARVALGWDRNRGHASALTSRVAAGRAIDTWRRRQRAHRQPRRAALVGGPARGESIVDDRAELVEVLRRLPPRQRHAIVLRYLADLSEAATAEALGCTPGTVKQHTARGLRSLHAALSASTEE